MRKIKAKNHDHEAPIPYQSMKGHKKEKPPMASKLHNTRPLNMLTEITTHSSRESTLSRKSGSQRQGAAVPRMNLSTQINKYENGKQLDFM